MVRAYAQFDAAVRTEGCSLTFARAKPTKSEDGSAVAANVPRFADRKYGILGALTWEDKHTAAGGGYLIGSGTDFDGTPLVAYYVQSSATVYVLAWNESARTFSVASTTAYTALPGHGGTTQFFARRFTAFRGLIVLQTEWHENSIPVGMRLFISQDRGANWTPVVIARNAAAQNALGNYANEGISVGNAWTGVDICPVGGMGETSQDYSRESVWIDWFEYHASAGQTVAIAGVANAGGVCEFTMAADFHLLPGMTINNSGENKTHTVVSISTPRIFTTDVAYSAGATGNMTKYSHGGQVGTIRADYNASTGLWELDDNRVLYQSWRTDIITTNDTSYTGSRLHFHNSADCDVGKLLAFGDTQGSQGAHLLVFDKANYKTAPVSVVENFFGEVPHRNITGTPGIRHARNGIQPIGLVPGPDGCLLGGSDVEAYLMLRVPRIISASQQAELLAEVLWQDDNATAGGLHRTATTGHTQWFDGVGYVTGGHAGSATYASPADPLRLFSPDGRAWAFIPQMTAYDGLVYLCGRNFVVSTTTNHLMVAAIPDFIACRPLCINPGAPNILADGHGAGKVEQSAAPATNCKIEQVTFDGVDNRYEFAGVGNDGKSAGEALEYQPSGRPPSFSDVTFQVRTATPFNATDCGYRFIQNDADADVAIGQAVTMVGYVQANEPGSSADGYLQLAIGSGGGASLTRGFGSQGNARWNPFVFHWPAGSAAAGRPRVKIFNALATGQGSVNRWLLHVAGLYQSSYACWPSDPTDDTAQPHEQATLSGMAGSTTKTVAALLWRSNLSTHVDVPLLTIRRNATNYLAVTYIASSYTVRLSCVIGGAPAINADISVGANGWNRGFPLGIVVADDGTHAHLTVSSLIDGVEHATATAGSLASNAAVTITIGNEDLSAVPMIWLASLLHDTAALDQAGRAALLTTGDLFRSRVMGSVARRSRCSIGHKINMGV